MIIYRNPSNAKIKELITLSSEGAARWIEEKETGDVFYWPSDIGVPQKAAGEMRECGPSSSACRCW